MTEPRVRLERIDRATARALVVGDTTGLKAARGWPHEDTLVAFGAALAHGDADLPWLVVRCDTGEVIGECGTKGPPDATGTVEIGYGLAAPSRGRGYGAEAVGALLAALAEQPAVRHVLAEVEHTNVASRRIVERLGFRLERVTSECGYWIRDV